MKTYSSIRPVCTRLLPKQGVRFTLLSSQQRTRFEVSGAVFSQNTSIKMINCKLLAVQYHNIGIVLCAPSYDEPITCCNTVILSLNLSVR